MQLLGTIRLLSELWGEHPEIESSAQKNCQEPIRGGLLETEIENHLHTYIKVFMPNEANSRITIGTSNSTTINANKLRMRLKIQNYRKRYACDNKRKTNL